MSFRTLLSISAVLALLFGISFALFPTQSAMSYGFVEVSAGHRYALQWFGITLVSLSTLNWGARNLASSEARRAIVVPNLVHGVLGLVLSLLGVLQGTVNAVGWSSVAIYALLSAGFGLLLVGQHPESPAARAGASVG